jgi:hypothetical protein
LAVAVLALTMVFVMVRYSQALMSGTGDRPGESRSWGLAYALVWAALIGAFLVFLDRAGTRPLGRYCLGLVLVALAWYGFNRLLIAFGRGLQRAQERVAQAPPIEEPEPLADLPAAAPPPAAPARRIPDVLSWAGTLAIVLAAMVLGTLPPFQRFHVWTTGHQRALLWVTIPMGAVGFVLFMGGIIHLVLTQGRPMRRQEIDEMEQRRRKLRAGPAVWSGYRYRTFGLAVGAQAEEGATFSEIKDAWRTRAWEFSPRWRRMFLLMLGVALLVVGLFGSLFAIAPAGVQILIAAALVYSAVRAVIGFARA